MDNKLSQRGYTLIELMLVVAILSILMGVGIPQLRDQISYAYEASTRGNLGTIRSTLSVYYGDNDGKYPVDISVLTIGGKYLLSFPYSRLPAFNRAISGGGSPPPPLPPAPPPPGP